MVPETVDPTPRRSPASASSEQKLIRRCECAHSSRITGNPEVIPGQKSQSGKFDFLGYTSSNAVLDRETKR